MNALPIANTWFERTKIDASITLLWEPYVIPLMRCNIWHVRGRDRDLVALADVVHARDGFLMKGVDGYSRRKRRDEVRLGRISGLLEGIDHVVTPGLTWDQR